jgi:hypothetical protein
MLVIFGYGLYYVAPVSYLYGEYAPFAIIMQMLLLFTIVGSTFLASQFQPFIEEAIAYLMVHVVFFRDSKLYRLLIKQMRAHRKRNMTTAAIFACCLSFLIFCGTGFTVIADLVVYQAEAIFATDLYAQVADFGDNMPTALHEEEITRFLQQ